MNSDKDVGMMRDEACMTGVRAAPCATPLHGVAIAATVGQRRSKIRQ
ncbi:unnamed protein product [Mycetohabitans rhizoxinica HKI 454]|uniref:Uncharacterized protein n=1 Tax=Mycetohabitans rhizoxinica (strain DSM 19002 / CIP 109453 / HKI 454) TaxID=882378 RepID=E5AM23_MYCRK|nr:unnamed protein product [Mycetohabitans rhizoxinica HKI 454]